MMKSNKVSSSEYSKKNVVKPKPKLSRAKPFAAPKKKKFIKSKYSSGFIDAKAKDILTGVENGNRREFVYSSDYINKLNNKFIDAKNAYAKNKSTRQELISAMKNLCVGYNDMSNYLINISKKHSEPAPKIENEGVSQYVILKPKQFYLSSLCQKINENHGEKLSEISNESSRIINSVKYLKSDTNSDTLNENVDTLSGDVSAFVGSVDMKYVDLLSGLSSDVKLASVEAKQYKDALCKDKVYIDLMKSCDSFSDKADALLTDVKTASDYFKNIGKIKQDKLVEGKKDRWAMFDRNMAIKRVELDVDKANKIISELIEQVGLLTDNVKKELQLKSKIQAVESFLVRSRNLDKKRVSNVTYPLKTELKKLTASNKKIVKKANQYIKEVRGVINELNADVGNIRADLKNGNQVIKKLKTQKAIERNAQTQKEIEAKMEMEAKAGKDAGVVAVAGADNDVSKQSSINRLSESRKSISERLSAHKNGVFATEPEIGFAGEKSNSGSQGLSYAERESKRIAGVEKNESGRASFGNRDIS